MLANQMKFLNTTKNNNKMKSYKPLDSMRTNSLSKIEGGGTVSIIRDGYVTEYTKVHHVSLQALSQEAPNSQKRPAICEKRPAICQKRATIRQKSPTDTGIPRAVT